MRMKVRNHTLGTYIKLGTVGEGRQRLLIKKLKYFYLRTFF